MLSLDKVNVFYAQSQILREVTLKIGKGQVVGLLGRNGVGKTTLLKTTMGILKPRSGTIQYSGQEITRWAPHLRARAGIGYVPQGRGVFPFLSVKENLLMGLEANPKLKEDQLAYIYELFPVLSVMSKRLAGTLSGGQQQQLAIGRALISKPKLLVLDEPTEGIQPSIVMEIEQVLIKLQQQQEISILLVEQFVDFALGVANYFYVMDRGSIVFEGTDKDITQGAIMEYLSV